MSSRPASGRGFTLVELMVSLLVSSIVVAGALFLLNAQQRAFQGGSGDRALQEAGRVALERLTSELRFAGYGVDPPMAFDFGASQSPMAAAKLPPGVGTIAFGGYECANPVTCRDRVDGPDELVFLYRDPNFGKAVVTAPSPPNEGELILRGPLNNPILAGQVLQVVCMGGDLYWAYVTVDQRVEASPDAEIKVALRAATGGDADFPAQNKLLTSDGCFSGDVRAFKLNRHRYFIESYTAAGEVVPWGTAGARPYLMLDEGLTDGKNPIHTVVAQDVEDLQLAYVFPLAQGAPQVHGDTLDVPVENDAKGIDLAPATIPSVPLYSTPSKDKARATFHPANLRAVRVGVVVRQPEGDLTVSDPVLPALFNRKELVRESNRRRAVFQTTVAIPNMDSRAPVYPTYGVAGAAGDAPLNHGGG